MIFSDAFWQQQLRGVDFASWIARKRVATVYGTVFGIIHVVVGVLYLGLMQDAWEVRTPVFSIPSGQTEFEIEVPETSSRVAVYVEIPTFYSTYRSFTLSKDPRIVGGVLLSPTCGSGKETLDDFMLVRGGDAFREFMKDHPLLNPAALDPNSVKGTDQICPCGLNSFSLLLDMFDLTRDDRTAPEQLDESRVARDTDIDFVKAHRLKTSATSDTGISGVFDGQTGDVKFDNTTCWIRGNTANTPIYQQDRAFLRLLSFYRASTANFVRVLVGHYDNLEKGRYVLHATKVDPSWNLWPGADRRRVILSSLSPVGEKFIYIPALCIFLGLMHFVLVAILRFVKPKEV